MRLWDSLPVVERHRQRLAEDARRTAVRPRVDAALADRSLAEVGEAAASLRADPDLVGPDRAAALRLLLERTAGANASD